MIYVCRCECNLPNGIKIKTYKIDPYAPAHAAVRNIPIIIYSLFLHVFDNALLL